MPAPKGNKNAKGNKGGGRPTSYRDEFVELAYQLSLLGATDAQMADAMNVDESTINNWKKAHVEFFEALKKGKTIADAEVAQALYHRALGYEHSDVHITNYQGEITETDIIKHYPPDTAAAFIWLKNRSGWRDKQEVEHSGGVNMIYDPVLDGPLPDDEE